MKLSILTALAVILSINGYSQMKGTNALGLGINSSKFQSTDVGSATDQKNINRQSNFSLSYGYFIMDKAKIGIDLLYGSSKNQYGISMPDYKVKSRGINLNYQQYIPVFKTLYAFAGGRAGYSSSKTTYNDYNEGIPSSNNNEFNNYSIGANGGLAWFINKRWALETELLSANASYGESKRKDKLRYIDQTNFNLATTGFVNNLAFKIFLTF
ncbi:hypothetical protein ACVWYN_003204 [Pedobacter sp. UYP24]